jgi:hypothetical protein
VNGYGTNKFIPVIRQKPGQPVPQIPKCLGYRLSVDFSDDSVFSEKYENLLRELHDVPLAPKPPLG